MAKNKEDMIEVFAENTEKEEAKTTKKTKETQEKLGNPKGKILKDVDLVDLLVKEEEDDTAVQFVDPIIKIVEIIPKRDFRACIGKTWYFCNKGVKQRVPTYVRDIFLKDPTKL